MSTINEKMGLKPRTRVRAATHGSAIASAARCPICRCHHVIHAPSIASPDRLMCGTCSHFWIPTEAADGTT